MYKRYVCFIIALVLFFISSFLFAETIILKSGERIEGKVLKKTGEYIEVDCYGIPIVYWRDEIDHILSEEATPQKPAQVVYPRNRQSDDKTFLWQIRSRSNTAYILGSIHVAKEDLYPLNTKIEEAFDSSDILAVEANINRINLLENQLLMEKGTYSDSDTLERHLSRETFQLIKKKLQEDGIDIDQVSMYKPWFLALQLQSIALLRLGFNPLAGVDMYFLQKAKRVVELESIEYQITLFDNLTEREQELMLLSTVVDLDILRQEMDRIVEAWQSGDIQQMESILKKGLEEYPELFSLYDKVLFQRNKNMVLKIEELMKTTDTPFIIVGAGHLVGKEGIIQQLKERGYSLDQL